ncbi:MAG: DUF2189 domain-containing protein [Silicimonas sp.]|nr:DUF2189 domain-containing protein [Silicimonas sp.]
MEPKAASPKPEIGRLTPYELMASIKAGLWDFRTAPAFGLAFSAVYVLGGAILWWIGAGTFLWTLAMACGFPLIAPFAAVGLYEVSRRIEADEPLTWREVLGVVWNERRRQLPWAGVILALVFLFWSFFAHMTLALFLGVSRLSGGIGFEAFLGSADGLLMLAVQGLVGAVTAFLTFGLTVVALPLMVDKEIDFVSAMLISLQTVAQNKIIMGTWALLIAASLLIAMLPVFLGLLVVLPVLGHATWHLYRRALYHPMASQ